MIDFFGRKSKKQLIEVASVCDELITEIRKLIKENDRLRQENQSMSNTLMSNTLDNWFTADVDFPNKRQGGRGDADI